MNWYQIRVPHDSYGPWDVGKLVLLEGGAREASLELMGYLRFMGAEVVPVSAGPKKRGRGGKQAEAGPPEVESVGPVSGDEPRGEDSPSD